MQYLIQNTATLRQAGGPCRKQEGRGKRDTEEAGTPKCPPFHNLRGKGQEVTLLDSWGKEGWLRGPPGCPGQGPGIVSCVQVQLVQGIPWPGPPVGPASRRGCPLDAQRTHHHASGAQRVAGTLEVLPADAVDLAQVLADWVVDAVEV